MKKKSQGNRTQSVLLLVFSLAAMIAAGYFVVTDFERIKIIIDQAGIWGVFISIAVYAILGVTLVPSEPLTILIGALYGPLIATLVAGVGNTLAALVEYFVGKRIGQATNFLEQKEKLPFGLGKLRVDSPLFLIGARMIPGYGPKVVSVLAGVYHISILTYLWTTAIPAFLGAAIFAFGGSGLGAAVIHK